tara:strand:- start:5166 stop:5858 length:693 start_codon:yes stop_codon:yes gene_type:complete
MHFRIAYPFLHDVHFREKVSEIMKVVVLGANGRTGMLVVNEALARGETVTAVVRSDAKRPTTRHERLTVLVGDPCDPDFLSDAFRDQDVVISALGGRRPSKKATSIYWKSADAITEAAAATGLKRAIFTSTALLFPAGNLFGRALRALVPNVVRSARRMEERLFASDLDVIFARCGFLSDAEETAYRAERGALPAAGSSVSRPSLAQFLVDKVQSPFSGRQVYGVSRPAA